MKRYYYKFFPILSIITMCVFFIVFARNTNVFAINKDIVVNVSNFDKQMDGENSIYSNTMNGPHDNCFIYLSGKIDQYDMISFDVKYLEATGNYGKVCFQMLDGSGGTLCFEIYNNWNGSRAVAVVRYPNVESTNLARVEMAQIEENNWINITVAVTETKIYCKVNNQVILNSEHNYGKKFWKSGQNTYLYTIGTKSSYKNITLSKAPSSFGSNEWIPDSNWTEEVVGDETIYETTSDVAAIWYNGDISTINSLEAMVQYSEPSRGDGGVCLQVNHTAGTYLLNLAPNTNPINPVIRVYDQENTNSSPLVRREISRNFGNTSLGDWIKLKIVISDNIVLAYVNDIIAYKQFVSFTSFKWIKAGFNTFMCGAKVKNLTLSYTEIDLANMGYIDLEFSDNKSISVMTAKNASLSYSDGSLCASIIGENPSIETPYIDVIPGNRYSMKFPLRNTFLVRLANLSDAKSVNLYFTTSGSVEEYCKSFAILPNSDFTSYYFNVSDIEGIAGYLRKFRFVFPGVTTGEVKIDAITFEREDPIYPYCGEILSCIANIERKTVVVTGKTSETNDGKKVELWQSDPRNYNDSLSFDKLIPLANSVVHKGTFTIEFPLFIKDKQQTQLSNLFLASIDGVKVSKSFTIENYYDFNSDEPRFTINYIKTANVLEYGAKGDSFTDDTAAIQAAIDDVSAAGGGKVIIPGDNSTYGKRYIITHLKLCDNLEFIIEKGAVLWQSQREDELNKTVPVKQRGFDTVTYGHNVNIDGLVWCTGFSTVNLPMILISNKTNVRITGGGTIRMNDTGGEHEDPLYFIGDAGLAVGQENRVQQIPVCIYSSSHIDFRDITLMRSNGWHCYMSFNEDVYVANILEREAVNVTADGFTVTSCKNLTIDRCFTYTSDDAVGICTAYDDGRGQFYRPTKPESNNATENIIIRHSFLFGGFGISWMPWGTAATNSFNQETRNVHIYDCSLGGHKASGTWPDDPFYGVSAKSTYTQTEDNDYCSVKDVYFHDNSYLGSFDLILNNIRLWATNFIVTDSIEGTIESSHKFLNGDFDKKVHKGTGFKDETNWVTGLSYWSNNINNGEVGTQLIGTKQAYTVDTKELITQNNYAGFIKGNGELFQGLYCTFGAYNFDVKVKLVSGSATIFARNAITKKLIASKSIEANSDFTNVQLKFIVDSGTTIQLGISHAGTNTEIVYLDDASLLNDLSANIYDVTGETIEQSFDDSDVDFTVITSGHGVEYQNGFLVTSPDSEYKIMLNNSGNLSEFEVKVDIKMAMDLEINSGLYLFAKDVYASQDRINAYNVQVESKEESNEYNVSIFRFDGKYVGVLCASEKRRIAGNILTLRCVAKNNTIFVFVENELTPLLAYEVPRGTSGNVGIRSQMVRNSINNFKLVTNQYVQSGGDKTELLALVDACEILPQAGYTQESYMALLTAIRNAQALADNAKQTEINNCKAELEYAKKALVVRNVRQEALERLQNVIKIYENYDRINYTEASFQALESELSKASIVGVNYASTEEELNNAYQQVMSAVEKLEYVNQMTNSNATKVKNYNDQGWMIGFIVSTSIAILSLSFSVFIMVRKRRS